MRCFDFLPDINASRLARGVSRFGIVAGAAFGGALLLADDARAGYPVVDSSQIAQVKNILSEAKAQVNQLSDIKSAVQDQLMAIGEFGAAGDLFGDGQMANAGSRSDFYENVKKMVFDPCAINLCKVGSNPIGSTDIEEVSDWIKKNLYSSKILSGEESRDLREMRRRARVYAAVNGLALANVIHNDLASSGEAAAQLESAVSSAKNLREDVKANSAIALATYKVELQKMALLSSLLQVTATDFVDRTGVYHDEGGTEFADVFNDDDFTANDVGVRTGVTIPGKGGYSTGN